MYALLQVTGRSVRPTRRIAVPSDEAHRLITKKVFGNRGPLFRLSGLSLTRLTTVPLLRFTGSLTTRRLLPLVASAALPGPSLTLGDKSRYIYNLCLSMFDGRHNLFRAGTVSVRVSWTSKIMHCIGLSLLLYCRASLNCSMSFPSSYTNKVMNLSFDLLALCAVNRVSDYLVTDA